MNLQPARFINDHYAKNTIQSYPSKFETWSFMVCFHGHKGKIISFIHGSFHGSHTQKHLGDRKYTFDMHAGVG